MGSEPISGYAIVGDGVYEHANQLEVVVRNTVARCDGLREAPSNKSLHAIIASSVIFGLGHLPFVFALVPGASVALILYVIVENAAFGLVAGYLYWKKGT
jgi:hypothetical protein